ncbi:DNA/RNA non-specific endonuclease [Alloiococcus sp. CFN-8]|uniref:DNA/RNA non-specific endonuclease n=1 Tax=Alloiococcus sp. CFN-8 TaxID=3416081 RepID=UPI003CF08452
MKSSNKNIKIIGIILALLLFVGGILFENNDPSNPNGISSTISTILEEILGYETPVDEEVYGSNNQESVIDVSDIPEFSGTPYIAINNNIPDFSPSDYTTTSYENYSELDSLGRCGVAMASIGTDLMPTEERGNIGHVKPTGWQTVKYDIVDGKYLYNRCHLIGYQLTAENANKENLITGTRYMNVDGMLPFENMVADYIKETNNHVLYRITPIYEGNNLVATGVQMEAYSVEDNGDGISFNVFVYNAQPGVTIDYSTGESWLED